MKTATLVLDNWKLPLFKKHLDAAGYAYTEHAGFSPSTLTLRVSYEWVASLKPIIEDANAECATTKKGAVMIKRGSMDEAFGAWHQRVRIGTTSNSKEVIAEFGKQVLPEPEAIGMIQGDEIVSGLYRIFKDWSQRGFGPDDVTWCEVKAYVMVLLCAHVQAQQPVQQEDISTDVKIPLTSVDDEQSARLYCADVVNRYARAVQMNADLTAENEALRHDLTQYMKISAELMAENEALRPAVLTFNEFVQYGRDHGANLVNGMPWSFKWQGLSVTHETDAHYSINLPSHPHTLHFRRGQVLRTYRDGRIEVATSVACNDLSIETDVWIPPI